MCKKVSSRILCVVLLFALPLPAFADASEQSIGAGTAQGVHTTIAPSADAIEEIKVFLRGIRI